MIMAPEEPLMPSPATKVSHTFSIALGVLHVIVLVAFGIGATTVIPALRSFCLFATVAVGVDYALQLTLFLAHVALDEERIDAGRHIMSWYCSPKAVGHSGCATVRVCRMSGGVARYAGCRYGSCFS